MSMSVQYLLSLRPSQNVEVQNKSLAGEDKNELPQHLIVPSSKLPPHLRSIQTARLAKEALTGMETPSTPENHYESSSSLIGERNIRPSKARTQHDQKQSSPSLNHSPNVEKPDSALTEAKMNTNASLIKTESSNPGCEQAISPSPSKPTKVSDTANVTKDKSPWVPPHLRTKPSLALASDDTQPHLKQEKIAPMKENMSVPVKALSNPLTDVTQETPNDTPRDDKDDAVATTPKDTIDDTHQVNDDSIVTITHEHSSEASYEANNDDGVAVVLESSKSVKHSHAVGESIVLLIRAIEVTGYLDSEESTLLQGLRKKITTKLRGLAAVTGSLHPNDDSALNSKDPSTSPISDGKDGNSPWSQGLTSSPFGSKRSTKSTTENSQNASETKSASTAGVRHNAFMNGDASKSKPDVLADNTNTDAMKATPSKVKPNGTNPTKVTATDEDGDREHKTYFEGWGVQEKRDLPAAKIRTVIISQLPPNADATFVASLVYGGPVENITLRSSDSMAVSATVRFLRADDCKDYYNETSNGVVYKKDSNGREQACFVHLGKDVDVVGGLLAAWIEQGATRCVRAVGVEKDLSVDKLKNLGEMKGRKLEGVSDTINPAGFRTVVWRFCKIDDAFTFKAAMIRDEDWEPCNIHFAIDPCATATGVHFRDWNVRSSYKKAVPRDMVVGRCDRVSGEKGGKAEIV